MEFEQLIREYIARSVLFGDVGVEYDDETSFFASGILDSMAVLELISWIEKTFGIKVDIRDITPENFDSVSRLAAYLRKSWAPVAATGGKQA